MNRLATFAILALLCCGLCAQSEQWLNFGPGQRCHSIAMEGDYAWIATSGGLARYHRQQHTVEFFNHANSGLPSNRVWRVGVDPAGVKWICIYFGALVRFDGNTWQSFYPDFFYNTFTSIAVAGIDDIWLGTETGGLVHFDGENFSQYTDYTTNTSTPNAYAVTLDNAGRVWFSNHDGFSLIGELVCWDGIAWSYLNHPQQPGAYSCATAIAFDADNNPWIGTNRFGVFHYDGSNWTQYTRDNSQMQGRYVYSVAVQSNCWVLIATEEGLNCFTGSIWSIYNTSTTPMLSNYVWDIAFDDQFTTWLATDLGAMRHMGTMWLQINTSNTALTDKRVNAQLQTPDGTQWFGSYDGLFSFDGLNWELHISPANDQEIIALDLDSAGNIWFATRYSGVFKFDGNNFTAYTYDNSSLPANSCRSLAIDSQDRVWIATRAHGLCCLDGDAWTVWNTSNSLLPTNYLTMVEVDELDNVWVNAARNTTEPWALIKITDGNWTFYVYDPLIPGLNTFWVHDMKYLDGSWWFATSDGIARLSGDTWTIYNEDYFPLPSYNFRSLAFDSQGCLWAATLSNGIARFHDKVFTTYMMSDSGIACNSANYLYIDSQDWKWAGHNYDGVSVLIGGGVPVIEEEVPSLEQAFRVWPNPFADRVSFHLDQPRGEVKISLYNLRGQRVGIWDLPASSEMQLDLEEKGLSGLPSGIWLWQAETGNKVYRARSLRIK